MDTRETFPFFRSRGTDVKGVASNVPGEDPPKSRAHERKVDNDDDEEQLIDTK